MARFDPHSSLEEGLRNLLIQEGLPEDVPLPPDIPVKWERFDDVVILPASAFVDEFWSCVSESSLWVCVATSLGAKRVFRKGEVDGPMRKPKIEALLMGSRVGLYGERMGFSTATIFCSVCGVRVTSMRGEGCMK